MNHVLCVFLFVMLCVNYCAGFLPSRIVLSKTTRRTHSLPVVRAEQNEVNLPTPTVASRKWRTLRNIIVSGSLGAVILFSYLNTRKVIQEATSSNCPYCMGSGLLLCGECMGRRYTNGTTCSKCHGHGTVVCMNCKGDGKMMAELPKLPTNSLPSTIQQEH